MILGLVALLKDSRAGKLVGRRVYPVKAQNRNGAGFIVVTLTNNLNEFSKDGEGGYDVGNVQIDVYHKDFKKCDEIASEARQTVVDYSGASDGETFQFADLMNNSTEYEEDTRLYRIMMEIEVTETVIP